MTTLTRTAEYPIDKDRVQIESTSAVATNAGADMDISEFSTGRYDIDELHVRFSGAPGTSYIVALDSAGSDICSWALTVYNSVEGAVSECMIPRGTKYLRVASTNGVNNSKLVFMLKRSGSG